MKWLDGKTYKGFFKNDQFSGYGELIESDGRKH